jgi:hypothetical protein
MSARLAQEVPMWRPVSVVALAAALTAASVTPAPLSAQRSREPAAFGISGGLSLPTGDLKRGLSTGYSAAGHLLSRQGTVPGLRFRVDVSYDQWAFARDASVSYRSVGAIVNAHYRLGANAGGQRTVYLLGGLGLFNDKAAEDPSDTSAGMQAGAGVDVKLAGLTTFVEAKYVNVFATNRNLIRIPLTVGVRF